MSPDKPTRDELARLLHRMDAAVANLPAPASSEAPETEPGPRGNLDRRDYAGALAWLDRNIEATLTIPPLIFGPRTERTAMERDAGLTRPLCCAWRHQVCGTQTVIPLPTAIAWARNPAHCATARCAHCATSGPVDEFTWSDGTPVGT